MFNFRNLLRTISCTVFCVSVCACVCVCVYTEVQTLVLGGGEGAVKEEERERGRNIFSIYNNSFISSHLQFTICTPHIHLGSLPFTKI